MTTEGLQNARNVRHGGVLLSIVSTPLYPYPVRFGVSLLVPHLRTLDDCPEFLFSRVGEGGRRSSVNRRLPGPSSLVSGAGRRSLETPRGGRVGPGLGVVGFVLLHGESWTRPTTQGPDSASGRGRGSGVRKKE